MIRLACLLARFNLVRLGLPIITARKIVLLGRFSKMSMDICKTFSFQDQDAVGVDLDHTICKYKLDTTFPLIYNSLAKVLVEKFGYSKSLLDPFDIHKDFLTKGLVLDIPNGNFIKFSGDGIVLRATHGTTPLTDDEICSYYGVERRWEHFAQMKKTLQQTESVRYYENYFDMPMAVLAARLIDLKDKEAGERVHGYSLSKEVIVALNKTFNRENFKDGTSDYFAGIKANPSLYLEPCSETTKKWLLNLRASGKTVFLQTSSHIDYATLLLEHILGLDWESYFDICIMYARKPGFFLATNAAERPFYTIKDYKEGKPVTEITSNNCYLQGNIHTFNQYLRKTTGKENPKVAYVGDSIRSDVWPTHVYAKWSSVLVLEEMLAEDMLGDDGCKETDASDEPPAKLSKLKCPSDREREFLLSSLWGSFFGDKQPPGQSVSPSQKATNESHRASATNDTKTGFTDSLWGYYLKTYSTIAVPTVEHVSAFPLDHKFQTFASDNSGTAGFYPHIPHAYKQ